MPPTAPLLPAFLALAAIWLLTHRYFGIQHDGLLYAAQALARNDPPAFRHDLFFVFGSQDDYSLFSHAYAWLSGLLGLGRAALLLLVAAHVAWVLAAYALARHWLKGMAPWIGLALIFALPGHYGSQLETAHDILRYAEGFLTARSWAEPLVLAGVAATLAGHHRLAFAAVAAAFLFHPIMALPGGFFLAYVHLRPGLRHLATLAVLAAIVAFALPEMDAAWLAEVRRRARYLLLDSWSWGELAEPLAWIGILVAAATSAAAPVQRACRAVALAGATGYYLALLGTASHAALLIQTQPWRCLWLLKIAGLLALTGMFADRWGRSAADRWLLAGLAAAAVTANTLGGPVAVALAGVAHFGWKNGAPPELPRWLPVAGGLALAVVLLESVLAMLQQLAYLAQRLFEWADPASAMPKGDLAAFLQGPLALLLPLGLVLVLQAQSRRPKAATVVAAVCVAAAASGWYRANDAQQTALFSTTVPRPFGELIARTETVYWQNNSLNTWFLLRQGNYASKLQGASALFSRATAMESIRRLDKLAAFGSTDTDLPAERKTGHRATRAGLARLCADPVLDAVVLNHVADKLDVPSWFDPLTNSNWHLYRCNTFRSAAQ